MGWGAMYWRARSFRRERAGRRCAPPLSAACAPKPGGAAHPTPAASYSATHAHRHVHWRHCVAPQAALAALSGIQEVPEPRSLLTMEEGVQVGLNYLILIF